MKNTHERQPGMNAGSASLIMIFAVLCLTVFSVLSMSSAAAEMKTSERFAESVKAYYEADAEAVRIRNGVASSLAEGVSPQETAASYGLEYSGSMYDGTFTYSVPVGTGSACIKTVLSYNGGELKTLSMKEESTADRIPDTYLELADPEKIPEVTDTK